MGVKATSRHSNVQHEVSDSANSDHEPSPGSKGTGGPITSSRAYDRQPSQRRKVDSVLDDIMGDPDDFRDIADSDGESDGGRWEDTVRAALEHEQAEVGAIRLETRDLEPSLQDGLSKGSGDAIVKISNGNPGGHNKHSLRSPRGSRDSGSLLQNGKGRPEKAHENEGRKQSLNGLTVSSESKDRKGHSTKYFIIKSLNQHNLVKSVEKGIWATQAMNESVLNEAFETTERVLLVFSVNMSGHFQGYAQMTSPIGRRRTNVWSEANEGANPWGGTFSVDWLRLYELPFQKTVHLKNPLNFFKPVKISRDCQELTQEVGEALCALIDDGSEREGRPKRKVTPADLQSFSSKRKRKESLGAPSNGSQSRQHTGLNGGTRFPGANVSPGAIHDPFSSPGPVPRVSGGFSNQPAYPGTVHRVSKSRSPHPGAPEGGFMQERDIERPHRHKERDGPLERERPRDRTRSNSSVHSADLQVEEELLNLTYEEYLQRHGHSRDFNEGYHQGGGPPFNNAPNHGYNGGWGGRNAGMGFLDDPYSNYVANWYGRQGPPLGGNGAYPSNGMGNNYPVMRPPDPHWLGPPDDIMEHRPARRGDGKRGQGRLGHNGRSSRQFERMAGVGS